MAGFFAPLAGAPPELVECEAPSQPVPSLQLSSTGKLRLSSPLPLAELPPQSNLLAVSSTYGLIAVANNDGPSLARSGTD